MKEFFVGLLVLLVFLALCLIGILLYPIFLILGLFFQCLLIMILFVFAVWALGKAALFGIERLKSKKI